MSAGPLVVTYPLTGRGPIVAEELSGAAEAIYLVDVAPADRAERTGVRQQPHGSLLTRRWSERDSNFQFLVESRSAPGHVGPTLSVRS
jgi:hypothetical protein